MALSRVANESFPVSVRARRENCPGAHRKKNLAGKLSRNCALFSVTFTSLLVSNLSEDSDSDSDSTRDSFRVWELPEFEKPPRNLVRPNWILEMINRHLSPKWDVDDDSLHKTVLRPDSAGSPQAEG